MIKTACRTLAALAALAAFALPARATTYSTDYTDIWWAGLGESGWGFNLIQQGQTMFGTLFVYGVNNVPQWFVASDIEPVGTSQTQFTGTLYQTSGPYFGAPAFDPNAVRAVTVGSVTLTFTGINSGTLVYTVNGQQVTKSITRQSIRNDNLSGNYLGGLTAATTRSCSRFPTNAILVFETLNVQHASNNQVSMTVNLTSTNPTGKCTFNGPYTQSGSLGSITGNWSCVFGGQTTETGTFAIDSIKSSITGFSGHFAGSDQDCSFDGQFGGVRDIPNPPQ